MKEGTTDKMLSELYLHCGLARKSIFMSAFLLISITTVYGSEISLVIEVRDEKNHLVESEIVRFSQDEPEKSKPVGMARNGRFEGAVVCPKGTKIRAEPTNKDYMFSRREYCQPHLVLSVTSSRAMSLLESNLILTKIGKDYGTAAFISNELTMRWLPIDSRKAEKYRIDTIHLASEAIKIQFAYGKFEIKPIYDPDEWINPIIKYKNRHVMSQNFQDLLFLYQKSNNDSPTGKLDFKTLKSLAGDATVYELMTKKYKPAAPLPFPDPASVDTLQKK